MMDGLVFIKMFYSCLTTGNISQQCFVKRQRGTGDARKWPEHTARHEVWMHLAHLV